VSINTNQQLTIHDELLKALETVDRPGVVCTSGDMPLTMPGLKVDGLGTLSLPVSKTITRKLIEQCHLAPYCVFRPKLDRRSGRNWRLFGRFTESVEQRQTRDFLAVVHGILLDFSGEGHGPMVLTYQNSGGFEHYPGRSTRGHLQHGCCS